MKRIPIILIAACYLFTFTNVFGVDVTNLVLATGSKSGIYYGLGTNLAESAKHENLSVEVLPTQGSRENLLLLAQGKAQFCIAQSDVIHEALTGTETFTEPLTNIQAIAPLYNEVVHILVRNPLHLGHIQDIRGKRIAVGPSGGGTESNVRLILESAGISAREVDLVNMSFDEEITAIAKNQIDVAFFTSGYPMNAVKTILQEDEATMLALPPELLERLVDDDPYFRITYIPAGTYPNQNANITTLGVPAILLTSSNVSSYAVYAFTKSVFSSGRFNPYSARNSLTFPVSPGADRFYQEAGVYHKQHLQKILAEWIAPALVIIVVFLLIFKVRILARFFRMKDIPRVGLILVAVWLIGTSLMYYAEHKVNDYYGTLPSAAWSTLMNWINFGAKEPYTSLGRATSVVMTALGYGGMLWLLAEAASVLIQKKLKKEIPMKENHHVIINWNDKGAGIVEQLSNPELPKRHILIITRSYQGQARSIPVHKGIEQISGEAITEGLLKSVNLSHAHSIIILADDTGNGVNTDAENVLIVLTVKKLSAGSKKPIPIIVEILDPQSADLAQCAGLLDDGQIEIVSTQRLGQNLLAQVAVTPGLTKIYEDLLTFGHETNEIYSSPVPKSLVGKPIDDVFFALFKLRQKSVQIIPIAISRQSKILLNPCSSKNGNIEEGDELFAICDNRGQLKELDGLFHGTK
jgi:TRAP transporter TAXI family solute receptor